jgi:hypothetical protein
VEVDLLRDSVDSVDDLMLVRLTKLAPDSSAPKWRFAAAISS